MPMSGVYLIGLLITFPHGEGAETSMTLRFRSILLACLLLAFCSSAFALNPELDISQYGHTSWKIRDGAFKGEIRAITQPPDGYLWLGTEFGLVRFDGIRFVPWQPPLDQSLPSDFIWSLLTSRDGTLWIGTAKGLASWKEGRLTQYPTLAGQYIFRLMEDREGLVWVGVGGVPTGRLCSIQKDSVRCYGEDGSFGRGIFGLYQDSKGTLWAGSEVGLSRWVSGSPTFYPMTSRNGIQGLGEDHDGTLLVGWKDGVQRFVDGKIQEYQLSGIVGKFEANLMLRDRDGGLWIGTTARGLLHVHNGKLNSFGTSDGLTADYVYTFFEDREGNVWVSTLNGLDRFRDLAVATFTEKQGLVNDRVGSVLSTKDGSVWFGTYKGLIRWNNGQLTTYGPAPKAKPVGARMTAVHGIPEGGVHSLFEDDRGRIWISFVRAIGYLEDDRFVSIADNPHNAPILGIDQDTSGNVWIINELVGLIRLQNLHNVQQISWAALGHKDHASALVSDPVQGGIWLGFHLGGLAHLTDGQVRKSYSLADGLAEGRVNQLRIDPDGALWAATDGGLSRLKAGRWFTLNNKTGLPCNVIHWSIEDDSHSLWLSTECGLLRITRSELNNWSSALEANKEAKPLLHPMIFDSSEGVRIHPIASHLSPQVAKSSDGRLWFLPNDGVSMIDPGHLRINAVPPPLDIQQISADRKTYDPGANPNRSVELPQLTRDLVVDYTALSLVAPDKIQFRYKLENYDRDWQEVGNRRQAFYNNLRPGNYRFRVIACNNSGVWNETGAFLDFTIAPAYYQTTWFRVLLVLAVLSMLFAIYRLRVRQVAQQVRAGMEGRLDERERIARDLHDTLLQSVQGLILKFHAGIRQIPAEIPARETMEKALDHADQVLAEGRDRVRNLRATAVAIDDLTTAFQSVAAETQQGRKATFKTVVEGSVRQLQPLVQEESYCIGREAIVNALTHSGGRNVEVEIIYEPRQFRIRVRDDGHGIDSKILEEGGRSDHWGMQGMRERANKIGAALKLWSGHEIGTEVELTVPGTTAYQDARESKRSWSALHKKLIR
jgi:ligand-binding sensor domain-containing protein/signal transduction histidine kinase